jgi:hypothetical protein
MHPSPDYGFKLVVLQELLETGPFSAQLEALKAQPSIARRLTGTEDYEQIIPEMDRFFREVELTQEDLQRVTRLGFDGGLEIYHLVLPFWSGESNEFDVVSVDGFERLPNLERVVYCSMISEEQLERLRNAGVRVEV